MTAPKLSGGTAGGNHCCAYVCAGKKGPLVQGTNGPCSPSPLLCLGLYAEGGGGGDMQAHLVASLWAQGAVCLLGDPSPNLCTKAAICQAYQGRHGPGHTTFGFQGHAAKPSPIYMGTVAAKTRHSTGRSPACWHQWCCCLVRPHAHSEVPWARVRRLLTCRRTYPCEMPAVQHCPCKRGIPECTLPE